MNLLFRETIIGSTNDFDLWALDGIAVWPIHECESIDSQTINFYIDSFEKNHPNFRWTSFEVYY